MIGKVCLLAVLVACATATPTGNFWKGTFLDSTVEEMRSLCNNDDALACIKFKAMTFIDNLFQRDSYKLSEDIEVTRNIHANEVDTDGARGASSWDERIENYIQTHDVTFKLPIVNSKVTLGARNLDQDELDLKVNFSSDMQARKSKLKKIFIPILVFVVLKAITLIPLAIGVLSLKAWNALQLSFFSFIVSVSLAVFQLCKKIAADNAHPQIAAHSAWDGHYAARSLDDAAQQMAYSAYLQ